jgi:hypothetical protein
LLAASKPASASGSPLFPGRQTVDNGDPPHFVTLQSNLDAVTAVRVIKTIRSRLKNIHRAKNFAHANYTVEDGEMFHSLLLIAILT